ncbi:hypothetical protein BOX15_Mlig031321g1, partial [Macrostomum lignano]
DAAVETAQFISPRQPMKASDLIAELLNAAEKSAEVARAIRREETLFQLLIEEKTGDDKGKRFGFDFKTLADVLIQEMIRHDLEKKFSGMGKRVTGEENNKFTNIVGESVTVEIKDNKKKTMSTLMKILSGNDRAAGVLSELVHQDVTVPRPAELQKFESIQLDKKTIGVWVDPSTARLSTSRATGTRSSGRARTSARTVCRTSPC